MAAVLKDRDLVSGAALAALGAFVLSNALEWTYLGPDGPGPGFFPFWYGLAMMALALGLMLRSALRPDPDARTAVDWPGTGRALLAWALLAGSIALMDVLGFPLAFALLALAMIRLVMGRSLATAFLTAVPMALAFWLLFGAALGISLPQGRIWPPVLSAFGIG